MTDKLIAVYEVTVTIRDAHPNTRSSPSELTSTRLADIVKDRLDAEYHDHPTITIHTSANRTDR